MDELVSRLIESTVLKTPRIIDAFYAVDRADFLRPQHKARAYQDEPIPISADATISQPSTVAFMLELLAPEAGERILDVGSGSGWTTALLAHIAGPRGRVFGVELSEELVAFGGENIAKYDFSNAAIKQARPGVLGLPEHAPYNRILVSAAGTKFPQELVLQVKVGGRIVVPIHDAVVKIDRVSEEETETQEYPGFVFVPLINT